MTAPRRLIDADDEFERELIRSAHADRPSERALERMLLGLGVEFAKLPPAIASPTPVAATSGKVGSALLAKGIVTGMALGLAAAGGVQVVSRAIDHSGTRVAEAPGHVPRTTTAEAAAEPVTRTSAGEPTQAFSQVPLVVSSPGGRPRTTPTWVAPQPAGSEASSSDSPRPGAGRGAFDLETSSPPPSTLTEEMRLLDLARRALARGDAPLALSNLAAHQRAFPNGALVPEASVLKVRALLASGDRTSAEALGRRIIEGAPNSQHADAVRAALGLRTNP